MFGRWSFIVRLCALLTALGGGLVAPVHAGAPGSVAPAVCVARVVPGDRPEAMLHASARFDCTARQARMGSGDFWVRSAPLRWPVWRTAHVRTVSLWQHGLTVYGLYADGMIERAGVTSATTAPNLALGAMIELTLPPRAVPLVRLLWRVNGAANLRGVLQGPRVMDTVAASRADLLMCTIYAGFGGLCIALIVYNFALWGALRQRFQLSYCAMVAALLVYTVSSSGVLAWLCPWLDNNSRMRINYLMLSCAAALSVAFARDFFEARVFDGVLRRASDVVIGGLVGAGGLFFLCAPVAPVLLDRLTSGAFTLLLLLVPCMLWRAWTRRSNYLWLFAIAWAAPILFAGMRLANAIGLVGWNLWLDNSTVVSMAAEALLSSLAIAYRIRLLSLERDQARAEEMAARLLADSDPLTGLLNRRAFLSRAIGASARQQLIILDLDHFKQVNEAIGHDGGDEVLRIVARALREAAPAGALVARFGGEEFAVTIAEDAGFAPDALLQALRRQRMPFDLEVTASIGSCAGPLASEAEWKALYRAADRALFEAKAAGRDRARRGAMPPGFAAAA